MNPLPLVSIVVPFYNEEEVLPALLRRLGETVRALPDYAWELVLVNDGSADASVAAIAAHRALFPGKVVLRQFSRNFGHQPALMAGLEKAAGEAILFIDADLQDPPELFAEFLARHREGYEVVYAVRARREGSAVKKAAYSLFYRLFRRLADIAIPLDSGDFGLVGRRAADAILRMPEKDLLLRGLRSWVGFRQTAVHYERPERAAGAPKYTFRKLLRLATSAFFGYSALPLQVASGLGVAAVLLGFLYGCYALYGKLHGENPQGWTSLAILVLFLGGVQLVTIGIMGEYIARIYRQGQGRPLYLVAEDREI
ncbi:MAG TPA: glycosyltransferase family 2 protein [Candidatus Methylacidiphilales bacterium]